jgi:hypothetical protein
MKDMRPAIASTGIRRVGERVIGADKKCHRTAQKDARRAQSMPKSANHLPPILSKGCDQGSCDSKNWLFRQSSCISLANPANWCSPPHWVFAAASFGAFSAAQMPFIEIGGFCLNKRSLI